MTSDAGTTKTFGARMLGQGSLLFSCFAAAQAFSFARNAVIGHWLSKGDFGIAASITLMLQMIEVLSDVGADRLIVQAADGDDRRLMATAHSILLVRGVVTALIVLLFAIPAASFFHVGAAWQAFALAATVPLAKGFVHLDYRRRQRGLDNMPFVVIECLPQAVSLLVLVPILTVEPSYHAVVWVAMGQALVMVAASHAMAERRFELGLDTPHLKRLIAFGWPIWLSAFPLVAVYQGDRMLVGHLLGVEALAGYAAAFMVTMVPSTIATKVGSAVMLPVLAQAGSGPVEFSRRFMLMMEVSVVAAGAYMVGLVIAGDVLLPLVFGPNFMGLGLVMGWLGVMWMIRIVQSVPGMALMSLGHTRPFLDAGVIRALGLIGAAAAVVCGYGMEGVAAAGAFAEAASLVYIVKRLDRELAGLERRCWMRLAFLAGAGLMALGAELALSSAGARPMATLVFAGAASGLVLVIGLLAMPGVRRALSDGVRAPGRPGPDVADAGHAPMAIGG